MSTINTRKNKSLFALALISAVMSVLFSFMGAPFLRAFANATPSRFFWLTAGLLVGTMFFLGLLGLQNYKISETAVYVGAIWMTLGSYSEFEKRGTGWRMASLFSLLAGLVFAFAGYFLILKNLGSSDVLTELVEPLKAAWVKAFPESNLQTENMAVYIPGVFAASLLGALALGFVFETKVARLFNLKRERVASSLRWLELRLPDAVIWLTLFAVLFSLDLMTGSAAIWLKTVSINWLIFAAVAFFIQGLTVTEFMMRFYRFGPFMRLITYLLIALQLAPFIAFAGFVDYWADFRRLVRKKTKAE